MAAAVLLGTEPRPLLCLTGTEPRPLPASLGDGAAAAAGFPRGRSRGPCRLPSGTEPRPLPVSLGDGAAAAAGFPRGRSRGRCRLPSGAWPLPLPLPLRMDLRKLLFPSRTDARPLPFPSCVFWDGHHFTRGKVVRKAITPFISPEVGAMGNFGKWHEPNSVCRYVATYLGRKYLCLSRPKS